MGTIKQMKSDEMHFGHKGLPRCDETGHLYRHRSNLRHSMEAYPNSHIWLADLDCSKGREIWVKKTKKLAKVRNLSMEQSESGILAVWMAGTLSCRSGHLLSVQLLPGLKRARAKPLVTCPTPSGAALLHTSAEMLRWRLSKHGPWSLVWV